jgi:hypothetical protein
MSVIVPDDLWKDMEKRYARTAKRLTRFIRLHPDQHKCISPTGVAVMDLGKLLRALAKANRQEKETPS